MKLENQIYFQSRIIHADLWNARDNLTETMNMVGPWLSFMKLGLIALGNLADLDGPTRPLYARHTDVAADMKALRANLDFAKYLRNIFVGHINDDLIAKAYEWRPELRALPQTRELTASALLNIYVLETAINTYVAQDGSHQFFPSETDLV